MLTLMKTVRKFFVSVCISTLKFDTKNDNIEGLL